MTPKGDTRREDCTCDCDESYVSRTGEECCVLCDRPVPQDERQRYVPNGEGGANERCENCSDRASAHFCHTALTSERQARERAEEMLLGLCDLIDREYQAGEQPPSMDMVKLGANQARETFSPSEEEEPRR